MECLTSTDKSEMPIILKLTDTTHVYFLVSGAREIEAEDDEEE